MKRVLKAARGAALMTETTFRTEIRHGKCDFIPNDTIQDVLRDAMNDLPLPKPDAGERAFARQLQEILGVASPDQESRQRAAFRRIEAAVLGMLRRQRLHVAAEQVVQEALRFFAIDLDDPELRQIAQHGAIACRHAFRRGVAELLHYAIEYLRARGIGTSVHYIPTHRFRAYAAFAGADLPVTERAFPELLSLPLFPDMSMAQAEYVALTLKKTTAVARLAGKGARI